MKDNAAKITKVAESLKVRKFEKGNNKKASIKLFWNIMNLFTFAAHCPVV